MKNLTLAILALLTLSCTSTPKDGAITCAESSKGDVTSSVVCKLGENIEFITDINCFTIIDEDLFVASTMQQIYLYNMKGEQLAKIGTRGRARGEYQNPMMLDVFDGNIFVGELNGRKIIEYNQQGEMVQEYKIEKSYRDLAVSDKYIFLLYPIVVDDEFYTSYSVDVLDKISGQIVAQIEEYDDMDKIFSISVLTNGFIEANDNDITLLRTSDLTLNRYPIAEGLAQQLFDVDSPSYKLDTTVDYNQISQGSSMKKYIEMLENSSCPMCVGLHNDKIHIITNEAVADSQTNNAKYNRHLLIVDTKQGTGEFRHIESSDDFSDKRYQIVKNRIFSISMSSDGEYYLREMDI